MKRESKKLLDLRKGYTIDEVEDLADGRLIKMSVPVQTQHRSRFKPTIIAAMVGVGCGAIAGVSLALAAQAATMVPDVSKMGPEMTPESVQLVLEVAEEAQVSENPMEAELIESALVEQGYFREDVPLSFEIQDALHTACDANGIPYHVALGLIETESDFNPDALSTSGCYGLAQLNPEYIPEPIFYLLSMKAENATARAFQRTIAYDVLPAIRKYGVYATAETAEQLMNDPDFMIQTFTALKNERERRQVLEAQVEKDRPKVLFADAVATAHTSILVGELAKLLKQNGVDTWQNRLFNWMRSNGYLIRREGTDYNMPTQRSMEMGLFEIKETSITHADGHVTVNKTPKVTGKGQQYFIEKFLEQEPKATVCK